MCIFINALRTYSNNSDNYHDFKVVMSINDILWYLTQLNWVIN